MGPQNQFACACGTARSVSTIARAKHERFIAAIPPRGMPDWEESAENIACARHKGNKGWGK
jgi:hypothetical protein